MGTYHFYIWENRKFWLENQMVRGIPFGKLQKIWAVTWCDVIFFSFDLDIICDGSFSHLVKFYSFFMKEALLQVTVCKRV